MWDKANSLRFITILAVSLMCTLGACSSTVIFPKNPLDPSTDYARKPPEWLSTVLDDDAYVQVTASVGSDKTCITPIANSSIRTEQVGLVLSIRREGFEEPTTSAFDLPIATYQFSGKGSQSCWTPLIKRSVVVPFATFKTSGIPTLTLLLSSSTSADLTAVADAQIVLGVLAVTAASTGVGVATISTVTSLISSDALKTAQTRWEKSKQRTVQADTPVRLPWNELKTQGLIEVRIPIFAGEAKDSEKLSDAINRLTLDRKEGPIFFVVLNFEYRRSLFVNNSYHPAPNELVPDLTKVKPTKEDILNKRIADQLTVLQAINKTLPSVLTTVGGSDWSQCGPARAAIESLGFNRYDRAIVYHAILDQAREKWREHDGFLAACVPQKWASDMNAMYGAGHIRDLKPARSAEVPIDEDRDEKWIKDIAPRLEDIRGIVLLSGSQYNRELKWNSMRLKGDSLGGTAFEGGPWDKDKYNNPAATAKMKLAELAKIEARQAGCFVLSLADPQQGQLLFNVEGQKKGYWTLIAKFGGDPLALEKIWLQTPEPLVIDYVKRGEFLEGSACAVMQKTIE